MDGWPNPPTEMTRRSTDVHLSHMNRSNARAVQSGMMASPGSRELPAPATSIYVWGEDRRSVNFSARVLARELDPQFRWVEVAPPPEDATPEQSATDTFPPYELAPAEAIRSSILEQYLIPDKARRHAFDVNRFRRLPEPVQMAIGAMLSREPPRVLVVANLDHLGRYDPAGTEFYTQLIDWLNEHKITLLVTAAGGPLLERLDFDYSVKVPKPGPSPRSRTLATCLWGDCDSCVLRSLVESGQMDCAKLNADRVGPAP